MTHAAESAARRAIWFLVLVTLALTAASVLGWCFGGYL